MRKSRIALILTVCLAIAGCTSSNMDMVGAMRPSEEMTASVQRPIKPAQKIVEPTAEAPSVKRVIEKEVQEEVQAEPEAAEMAPEPQITALVAPKRAKQRAFEAADVQPRKFRDAKPINFGASSPKKLAVHGVDVSRWQGDIDWARLRSQGANFAYIKATDGGDHLDPMFKKNWRGANAAGLKRGAYHFFYWCRSASEQADWFIRNVPRVEGALPPVIDVEWNYQSSCKKRPSRERILEKMQVFMDRLEAHYGQRPVIYTAPDFYADNLRGAFKNYPFWLRAVAQHPSKVYPNRKWVFWQYSGSGLSHGVRGRIDLNAFHGTQQQWQEWLSRAGS
jgi:lysozyme